MLYVFNVKITWSYFNLNVRQVSTKKAAETKVLTCQYACTQIHIPTVIIMIATTLLERWNQL